MYLNIDSFILIIYFKIRILFPVKYYILYTMLTLFSFWQLFLLDLVLDIV